MIERFNYLHISQIVDNLETFCNESPHYSSNVYQDREYVANNLRHLLSDPTFYGLVYIKEDEVVGFILYTVGPSWYNPVIEANELILYVQKEHRNSTIAVRLIKEFTRLATEAGAVSINAGASTGNNNEGVVRLYERLGYTRSSAIGVTKLN